MRQKRFSIVATDSWANYHFIHTEYDPKDRECYYTADKWTLCGHLDTDSKDYSLVFIEECLTETKLLQYSVNHPDKKIICANCVAYFFSDEQD